jgi:hypothetical protein
MRGKRNIENNTCKLSRIVLELQHYYDHSKWVSFLVSIAFLSFRCPLKDSYLYAV